MKELLSTLNASSTTFKTTSQCFYVQLDACVSLMDFQFRMIVSNCTLQEIQNQQKWKRIIYVDVPLANFLLTLNKSSHTEYLLVITLNVTIVLTLFFPMFSGGSKGNIGGKRVKLRVILNAASSVFPKNL